VFGDIIMIRKDIAEVRKPTRDLGARVVELVPPPPVEHRKSFYALGKGVFNNPEHCADVCGVEAKPDYSAMGYTPEVLKYLRDQ
jgi:hypothetical protein